MNPARDFLRTYFHIEMAYEEEIAKEQLLHMTPEQRRAIKEGFEKILKERRFSAGDYIYLTEVDFESDEDLYRYLQEVYDYLFTGSSKKPVFPT